MTVPLQWAMKVHYVTLCNNIFGSNSIWKMVSNFKKPKEGMEVIKSDWRVNYHHLFWRGISKLLYYAGLQRLYLINIQLNYFGTPQDYWSMTNSIWKMSSNFKKSKEGIEVIKSDWRVNYHHQTTISKLLYYAGLQRLYLINIQLNYFDTPQDYWSGLHALNLREAFLIFFPAMVGLVTPLWEKNQ